jgi:hypothetical protein
MKDSWLEELTKHPFISSNHILHFICLEKKGTGIYLMKERSKTHRISKPRKKFSISPLHSLQQKKTLQLK